MSRPANNASNPIFWLFYTVIFLTPLMHGKTQFFIVNQLYHRLFFNFALLSLIIIVTLRNKSLSFRISGFEIFFALYLMINLASIYYSTGKFASEAMFLNLLLGFYVYILVINVVQNVSQLSAIFRALVSSTSLLGLLGIYQGIFGTIKTDGLNLLSNFGHRAQGTFENPNLYAGFLVLVIPLACYFFLFGDDKRTRICGAFSVIILSNALLWTGSRGGIIAIGSALMLLLFFLYRDRRLQEMKLIAVIIFLTITVYLSGDAVSSKVSETPLENGSAAYNLIYPKDSELVNVDRRLETYKKTLPMIWDHPVFGAGLSTYRYNFIKHYPEDELVRTNSVFHAHNIFLNIAAEVGLLGLFFFVMMLISLFRQSALFITGYRRYGIETMSLFGSLGLFAFLVHNLFDYTWTPQACQIAFFLIASLIIKQGMLQQKVEDSVRAPVYNIKKKIPLTGLLLVVIFLLVVSVIRPLYAFRLYERSVYLYAANDLPAGLSYAQKAVDTIPEYPLFHANLSIFYLRQWEQDKAIDKYKKGIAELKEAISLNPAESYFYSLLGEAHERFKDRRGAATAYIEVIKLNPDDIELYHKVAFNYMELKEYEHAIIWLERAGKQLQKAKQSDRKSLLIFENCLRTAIACDESGQYAMARKYYKKTIRLAESEKIICNIGPLRERLEYVEKAIKENNEKAVMR
ncbi:MAG: O-antigen ligase family protein [Proteobacteria bacterium]|nr:O-antigen ligase family protein [Pseudomonadota bacterium]MBU4068680.1 O-antigen ligase family protein [Pseudomonadota bacterium]